MAGRPKIFNEEEALNKAKDLFWHKGYESVSTEELLRNMGLHKGSLYHTFRSKKNLFSKAMERFNNEGLMSLENKLKGYPNPIDGIKDFFLNIAKTDKLTHQKGCFMGNTIAAQSGVDVALKEEAENHLKAFENLLSRYIQKAQDNGQIQMRESPEQLACYLLSVWNGINITRRIYPDGATLEGIIKMHLKILE